VNVPLTPPPWARIACVVVGIAVLVAAGTAARDLAREPAGRGVAAVHAIGPGIDGAPITFEVPEGWLRADPGAELGEVSGASRAALALLEDRRRAAEDIGASALMFDLDSFGHMEVTYAIVEDPVSVAAQAIEDRREVLEATEGVEVVEVRQIELAAGDGHLIRFVVGSGEATNHRLQIIAPFDGGYAVFAAQSADRDALEDVLAIAPSMRIG
jgi:hypothetical protein